MGKIACSSEKDKLYVDFLDYKNKAQIKDFYKIFKKGSGYTVSEYEETDTKVLGLSGNADSIRFEWNEAHGCCVYAEKGDSARFAEIIYKMLCYRYKSFGKYREMLRGIVDLGPSGIEEQGESSNPDYASDDDEIKEDLRRLAGLAASPK